MLGIAVGASAGQGVSRAATFESEATPDSLLERPMVDVAEAPAGNDPTRPRLLVIDAVRPTPGAVRLAILERAGSWTELTSAEIALRPADGGAVRPVWALDAPWMLRVEDRSMLVIANATVEDAAYVTRVDIVVDEAGRERLLQGPIARLPFPVDDAGIADVHADGQPSLVVASARTVRDRGTCQSSTLLVVDPVDLATTAALTVRDLRVAGGIIGRFDEAPGDDLLAYAYPNCPAGPDTSDEARAVVVSLLDGTVRWDAPVAAVSGFLGSPLLIERPARTRDEAIVRGARDLVHLAWRGTWTATPIADASVAPLAAASTTTGSPGSDAPVTIAWLDAARGRSSVGIARLTDGTVTVGSIPSTDIGAERWARILAADRDAARAGTPPVAFPMAIDDGCVDLLLAGAVVGCGSDTPRDGPTWTGTRPIAVLGTGPAARLLIASGIGWEGGRLPGTPSPDMTGVPGWWRHGPSVPFVLAEADPAEVTPVRQFPVPGATVASVAGAGDRAEMAAYTGTRLFASVRSAPPGLLEPPGSSALEVLEGVAGDPFERRIVTRVPVPPGAESGLDGGPTRVSLGPAGASDGRWLVALVPVDDVGEVGWPVIRFVVRDEDAPALEVPVPFMSPVWPAQAELAGVAEPGATVRVDGGAPLALDGRGRFTFRASLAPWPQTFRVTATDAVGNSTTRDLSVVGGLDYRQVPLDAVLAGLLLVAAVLGGLFGSRRLRGAGPRGASLPTRVGSDGEPMPELEELPSGGSASRRR